MFASFEFIRRQVSDTYAEWIARICILRCAPSIEAPMHHRRRGQQKTEFLALGHRPAFIVEAPFEVPGALLFDDVALHGL